MKTLIKYIIALCLAIVSANSFAQKDSIPIYKELAYNTGEPDKRMQLSNRLIELSKQYGDSACMIDGYKLLGWAAYYLNDIPLSKKCYEENYKVASQMKNDRETGIALYNLGGVLGAMNQYQESLRLYKQAIILLKKANAMKTVVFIYRDMAATCSNIGLKKTAHEHAKTALEYDRIKQDSMELSTDYVIICNLYLDEIAQEMEMHNDKPTPLSDSLLGCLVQYSDSIMLINPKSGGDSYAQKRITREYNRYRAEIAYLKSMKMQGNAKMQMLNEASSYNQEAQDIASSMQDELNLINAMHQKLNILCEMGDYDKALDLADTLKSMVVDTLLPTFAMMTYKKAGKIYAATKKYDLAIDNFRRYDMLRSLYLNESAIIQNAEFSADYRHEEQISKMIEQQEHDNKIHDLEIKRQHLIIMLVSVLMLIALGGIFVVFRSLQAKRKHLEELNHKNASLSQLQEEIIQQRNTVLRSNQIMYESISYARQIQRAALPSKESVESMFPDSFVYYEPKDIVSGDFYLIGNSGRLKLLILADCTGHGVPGGFLSMLGISVLKEILRDSAQELMPGQIMDRTREYVIQALSNSNDDDPLKPETGEEVSLITDGMDMSIAAFDDENHTLHYAGAYQSLYVCRGGEVIRLKGDRMPVGRHSEETTPFCTETFETQSGDVVYLTSDGIASQMNDENKKFMSKRLLQFFKDNYMRPCEEQQQEITSIMRSWMYGTMQVDDLSLIGVRIH